MLVNPPPTNHDEDPFPMTIEGDRFVMCLAASRARDVAQKLGQLYYPTQPTFWSKRAGLSERLHPSIRARLLERNRPLVPYLLPVSSSKDELLELCDLVRLDYAAVAQYLRELDGPEFSPGPDAVRKWLARGADRHHPTPKAIAWVRMMVAESLGRMVVDEIAERHARAAA